jgi:hypothetical protein
MQRDGQLDDSEVWAKVAAGLREHFDQLFAHFLGKLREVLLAQLFDIGRRTDPIQ